MAGQTARSGAGALGKRSQKNPASQGSSLQSARRAPRVKGIPQVGNFPPHLVDKRVVGRANALQEEVVAAEALAVALQQEHRHGQQATQHVREAVAQLQVGGWMGG
jgi:hypothetical protein